MADPFANHAASLDSPARHAAAVVPHDTTALTNAARALYVGTAGDVEVITVGGETVVFPNVPAGTILPVCVTHVKADNSDPGTDIVALW